MTGRSVETGVSGQGRVVYVQLLVEYGIYQHIEITTMTSCSHTHTSRTFASILPSTSGNLCHQARL